MSKFEFGICFCVKRAFCDKSHCKVNDRALSPCRFHAWIRFGAVLDSFPLPCSLDFSPAYAEDTSVIICTFKVLRIESGEHKARTIVGLLGTVTLAETPDESGSVSCYPCALSAGTIGLII